MQKTAKKKTTKKAAPRRRGRPAGKYGSYIIHKPHRDGGGMPRISDDDSVILSFRVSASFRDALIAVATRHDTAPPSFMRACIARGLASYGDK